MRSNSWTIEKEPRWHRNPGPSGSLPASSSESKRAAGFEHMTPAEWMRQMFRNALDASRERKQRARP